MKLHNDFQTSTLIDIAGQIAYHNEQINQVASEAGCSEVLQEDIDNIALYMSNYWLNSDAEQNKEGSPLQNRRDYFEDNYKDVVSQYCKDPSGLEPIEYIKFASPNDNPPDNNNPHRYMRVADIRYSNYDNNDLVIMANEYGGYLVSPDSINSLKCYIKPEDTLEGIEIEPVNEKDDEHFIEGIMFN